MSNSNPPDPTRNHPDKIASNNKVIVLSMKNMSSFKFDPSKNFLANNSADNNQSVFSFKPQQLIQPQISPAQQVQLPQAAPVAVQRIGTSGTILIRAQPAASTNPQLSVQPSDNSQKTVVMSNSNPPDPIRTHPDIKITSNNKVIVLPMKNMASFKLDPSKTFLGNHNTDVGQSVFSFKPQQLIQPQISPAQQVQVLQSTPVAVQKIGPSGTILIRAQSSGSIGKPQLVSLSACSNIKIQEPPVKAPASANVNEEEDEEEPPLSSNATEDDEAAPPSNDNEEPDPHSTVSEEPDSSSSILLCDEKIENVSTEVSPIESEQGKAATATPPETDDDDSKFNDTHPSVQDVRKNLSLELSLECDKENVEVAVDEESVSDDDSSLTESQRQLLQDYEETLIKSEISKGGTSHSSPVVTGIQGKPKRVRKPKNPTIIATLGLPYKAPQPSSRKSKVEKKLEFELDFHDPLNKIQWDDGIGGLNNCNKLFGFDEFGLIEVLNKKDAMAKLKQFDVNDTSNGKDEGASFKLRKIVDPVDQFVCVICAKLGTIRDFYSPEACSESCLAITKRKASEANSSVGKESSSESGLTTPIDERKLMFGGEMVPLQQLQQHLLEQELPTSKRKSKKRPTFSTNTEEKFQWDTYLTAKSVPAPVELFKSPYPRSPNPFKVGMKLEAIDPANQKLFCVSTVEEKLGYRIKLHFDGYPAAYDFWVNADSANIFPAGFCHSTNRVLQTPPKWSSKKFDWSEYLDYTNSIGAPRALFPKLNSTFETNPFKVGMKLETTCDGKMYAASIIDVLDDRVLVSHDGHEEIDCVWLNVYSPYLHPINYHNTIADPECFIPPSRPFSWTEYLKATESKAAPSSFFYHSRKAFDFEPGLKLEVVDRVNRQLIRPATVLRRNEYKVQIIFDGFDINFAYWLDDDSEDIHPINWCEKTGHPIEHPAGFNNSLDNGLCPTAGCRGIGNGSHADRYFHDNSQECPYNKTNWKKLLKHNIGSHIDNKPSVKKNAKQSRSAATKESSKNSSRQSSCTRDVADFKDESKDVEVISVDVEFDDDVVEKISKKNRRKRKIVEELSEETNKKTKVLESFLTDYGPQLNYSYKLWKKNSKVLSRAAVDDTLTGNPMEWSVETVSSFVEKLVGDTALASAFQEQEIDGAAFICMSQDDLVDLIKTKIGVAIKIYNRVLHLREEVMLNFMKF